MALEDCPVCGEDHPRCHGHKKIRSEEGVVLDLRPCMSWPRHLEDVCQVHGAKLPTIKAAGAARRAAQAAEADARAVLGFTLDGRIDDPLGAMEGLAAMAIAMTESLAARVNALTHSRYESTIGTEQLRAEVALLERSVDRSMKMLEVVAKHKPDGEATAARNLLTALADKLDELEP